MSTTLSAILGALAVGLPAPPPPVPPITTPVPPARERIEREQGIALVNLSEEEVRELQRALKAAGFYEGPVTGLVNVPTRSALRAFQQQRGLIATGRIDPATARALGLDYSELADEPPEEYENEALTGQERLLYGLDLATLSSTEIRQVQTALKRAGFYAGPITGRPDLQTRTALRAFQRVNDLNVTGDIDQETALALGLDLSELIRIGGAAGLEERTLEGGETTTIIQPEAMTRRQRRELQERLRDLGYYRGPIDAIIGPMTRAALQRFQRDFVPEQPPTGELTVETARTLGLDVSELVPVRGREERQPEQRLERPVEEAPFDKPREFPTVPQTRP